MNVGVIVLMGVFILGVMNRSKAELSEEELASEVLASNEFSYKSIDLLRGKGSFSISPAGIRCAAILLSEISASIPTEGRVIDKGLSRPGSAIVSAEFSKLIPHRITLRHSIDGTAVGSVAARWNAVVDQRAPHAGNTSRFAVEVESAVFFNGTWSAKNRMRPTLQGIQFHADGGGVTNVQAMEGDFSCPVVNNGKVTAVSLSYAESGCSMLIIMPNEGVKFEAAKEMPHLVGLLSGFPVEHRKVRMRMPVISMGSRINMAEHLSGFGILGSGPLVVNECYQDCRIVIDEKGTRFASKGSIVSSGGFGAARDSKLSDERLDISFGRPFFFLIIMNECILSAGRVAFVEDSHADGNRQSASGGINGRTFDKGITHGREAPPALPR